MLGVTQQRFGVGKILIAGKKKQVNNVLRWGAYVWELPLGSWGSWQGGITMVFTKAHLVMYYKLRRNISWSRIALVYEDLKCP